MTDIVQSLVILMLGIAQVITTVTLIVHMRAATEKRTP